MRSNLLVALVGVAVSIAVVVTFSTGLNRVPLSAQDPSKRENFGGHSPGYPILGTTGDVLDPTSLNIDPKTAVIDPMKYLTFNGTIPGPTLRATEGDLVRITLINNGTKFHSIHFHGIHKSEMDGVFEGIAPGGKFTYEFTAKPFGVFPYHCHMQPLEEHITHGLYGVFIIDPKKPRADADEMVMVMNGYDTDFDAENNFYTVNGIPYYYMHHPIQIDKNRLIRIYLLNILEFDPINNFHLHANMFDLYRTGTKLIPDEYTDIVTMSQGERGILEFSYKYPGKYMFHAHKTEFAEKGWVGLFLVKDSTAQSATENSNLTSIERNASYSTSEFSNTGNGTTSFVKTGGLN